MKISTVTFIEFNPHTLLCDQREKLIKAGVRVCPTEHGSRVLLGHENCLPLSIPLSHNRRRPFIDDGRVYEGFLRVKWKGEKKVNGEFKNPDEVTLEASKAESACHLVRISTENRCGRSLTFGDYSDKGCHPLVVGGGTWSRGTWFDGMFAIEPFAGIQILDNGIASLAVTVGEEGVEVVTWEEWCLFYEPLHQEHVARREREHTKKQQPLQPLVSERPQTHTATEVSEKPSVRHVASRKEPVTTRSILPSATVKKT